MNEPITTVAGRLVSDVRFTRTQSGASVANFRIACNPRFWSKDIEQWVDGEAQFYKVSVWRRGAENARDSLTKGMPVVVHGRLLHRRYDRESDGVVQTFTYTEIDALAFGPDLSRCRAVVENRNADSSGGSGQEGRVELPAAS